MRTDIDLDAAAQAGIIGEDQAIALRNFQAKLDCAPLASAEKFQFFGGFADLSGAIGLALMLGAVVAVVSEFRATFLLLMMVPASTFLASLVNLRAYPATGFVLLNFHLCGSFVFVPALLNMVDLEPQSHTLLQTLSFLLPLPFFSWLFWRANRFPPTIALTLLVMTIIILDAMGTSAHHDFFLQRNVPGVFGYTELAGLLIGVGALLAAIWWDMSDIRRETYRSQVAFWLHCVAGFLVIRSLMLIMTGKHFSNSDIFDVGLRMNNFLPVMIMIVIATFVSLLLDRRSLLVCSILPSVSLFEGAIPTSFGALNPVGMMFAGAWLSYFAWSWNNWRRYLLESLPPKLAAQLPRPDLVQYGQRPTRRHLPFRPLRLRK